MAKNDKQRKHTSINTRPDMMHQQSSGPFSGNPMYGNPQGGASDIERQMRGMNMGGAPQVRVACALRASLRSDNLPEW